MKRIKQQDIRIKELESNIQCDQTNNGQMAGKSKYLVLFVQQI